LVESVTHCVHSAVTNKVATETNRLLEQLDLSPNMVSIQWVVESLRLGSQGVEVGEDAGVRGCRQMGPAP
jgi:hypothetical protein